MNSVHNRPTVLDYVDRLCTEFMEIHGDRRFADDHAMVTGFARYKGEPVLIVGHHKGGGGDTKQKVYRNFGYAKPEGYRKALRAMKLAEKFHRPVIAFIDTPAAYPGIESEERGISEAIALNLREMAALDVPIVVVVHGEGGSGGALGIAIGDRILMHERSEEHTFELQSRRDLVCRLLLEKKKTWNSPPHHAAKPARLLHARRGHGRRCHPRRT